MSTTIQYTHVLFATGGLCKVSKERKIIILNNEVSIEKGHLV